MVKATVPEAICTWTSTGRASTPSKATVDTRATISAPRRALPSVRTFAEQSLERKGQMRGIGTLIREQRERAFGSVWAGHLQ
jgi:hypothetical protein